MSINVPTEQPVPITAMGKTAMAMTATVADEPDNLTVIATNPE